MRQRVRWVNHNTTYCGAKMFHWEQLIDGQWTYIETIYADDAFDARNAIIGEEILEWEATGGYKAGD